MAKADIHFEKELWDVANELRVTFSENNYKNYILPLVFLKLLSERYEVIREELKDSRNDPSSDYHTTDTEEINYVLEVRKEYRSRNTFKIPENSFQGNYEGLTEDCLGEKLREEEAKENYEMCAQIIKYAESNTFDLNKE